MGLSVYVRATEGGKGVTKIKSDIGNLVAGVGTNGKIKVTTIPCGEANVFSVIGGKGITVFKPNISTL